MAVSADTLRLAIVNEQSHGVTPINPAFQLVRTTGEGLIFEHTFTNSNEMGGLSRGVKDSILTGGSVSGDINFELSDNDAFETLLAGAFASSWGHDPHGIGLNSDQINDGAIKKTFSIEKRLTIDSDEQDPLYSFQLFTGCLVNTATISISVGEPITGSFGFVGEVREVSEEEIDGATYTEAGTQPVMTAPEVTSIELLDTINDAPLPWLGTHCFTQLEISIENNARATECIGTLGAKETNLGQFVVSVSGEVYFAANDPMEYLDNQTPFTLRVTCEDANLNKYVFRVERLKFTAFPVVASGPNTDVTVAFQAAGFEDHEYPVTILAERYDAPDQTPVGVAPVTDIGGDTATIAFTGSPAVIDNLVDVRLVLDRTDEIDVAPVQMYQGQLETEFAADLAAAIAAADARVSGTTHNGSGVVTVSAPGYSIDYCQVSFNGRLMNFASFDNDEPTNLGTLTPSVKIIGGPVELGSSVDVAIATTGGSVGPFSNVPIQAMASVMHAADAIAAAINAEGGDMTATVASNGSVDMVASGAITAVDSVTLTFNEAGS